MGPNSKVKLNYVLVGDELGQIKLVQLNPSIDQTILLDKINEDDISSNQENSSDDNSLVLDKPWATLDSRQKRIGLGPIAYQSGPRHHKIIRILDDCMQREPAVSRAITNIRPIESCHEYHIDTVDRPNNLFVISNKVGQLFVCDTNTIRSRLNACNNLDTLTNQCHIKPTELNELIGEEHNYESDNYNDELANPMISPIYYNMNGKVPVIGAQPVNQTNVLVIYRNGDIQHVNIGQDVLQSTLKIKRKAIKMLGMGYNSDARAVHWRIDGSSGLCYFDTDSSTAHMNENDPLTEIVLSSPTHKMNKQAKTKSKQNLYHESPSVRARKCNQQERLVPTQVINMITSRSHQLEPSHPRMCKWSSITSLNLIYKKLALYDLVGSENFEGPQEVTDYCAITYKLNGDRLAIGGYGYAARVYDVQTQKPIYNLLTGPKKNPIHCPSKGEPMMVGDLDWLGGNKTTAKLPHMLATCSALDSIVHVYDLRSAKPIYRIDLTNETETKWMPYEDYPPGAIFTSLCASGAPSSTAVPSQQLVLGSSNGQLHLVDLRFLAKSQRHLGRMSGFCGGMIKELRFVSETFDTSKLLSCSSDRFMRIHRIQTAYTSFLSQRLAAKVFLGTKPTCIQPVCDLMDHNYLANLQNLHYASDSHLSTFSSGSW